jgi:putative addiction module component (TIGR02574 family)
MNADLSHLFQLSMSEKLQLVEDLWDNIATSEEPLPVPQWQIDELRRRKAMRLENPETGSSWEDVRSQIIGPNSNG